MGKTLSFWGQKCLAFTDCGKKVWVTEINHPHIRKGEQPHFGLNEKLIYNAIKENALIQVDIQGREPFRVEPLRIVAYRKIHKEPSVIKPGTTFNIYLYPIPQEETVPSF